MGFPKVARQTGCRWRRSQDGFSLIELLIVVTIILIIAAIAVPNYLRSRIMANEASATQSLRSINTAEITYSSTYGTGFAPLANLGGASPCTAAAATACIVDSILSGGVKSGYNFITVDPPGLGTALVPNDTYNCTAVPVVVGVTGYRSFCSDQTSVIRADPTGALPANPCSNSGLSAIQ
jgi:type IV pilus assembly protein PilA